MPATPRRSSSRRSSSSRRGTAPAAALASTFAAAALVLTGAPSATATAPGSAARTTLATVDAAGQQAALAYWTPGRMAAARPAAPDAAPEVAPAPVPEVVPDAAASAPAPAAGEAPRVRRAHRAPSPVLTGGAVATSTTWTGGGPVTAKVGRLYFTQQGKPYECSASSVESANESVVVTAGHCLSENGVASTRVVFVPCLAGATEPFGRWSAKQLLTTPQWRAGNQQQAAALNFDVGFVVLARRGGATLSDTVGALGIGFDAPLDRVTVFGYPGRGATSDGYTLKYCTGWRFPDVATTDQGTACSMAGGSSGGPWISGFQAPAGTGTVTSVVSFSYDDAPQLLFGPRFGAVVRDVYRQAGAVAVR